MTNLFNADSEESAVLIRHMVGQAINGLRKIASKNVDVTIGFDADSAIILANIIDIGAAPEGATITDHMRQRALQSGVVRIPINSEHARRLSDVIEIGLIRHENGVTDPRKFVLH